MNEIMILFIFVSICGFIMPWISKRNMHFGVQLPSGLKDSYEVKIFYRYYLKLCAGAYGMFIVAGIIIFNDRHDYKLILLLVLLLLIMWITIYCIVHKKVRDYKRKLKIGKKEKSVVIIDTNFRNNSKGKLLPSARWFLIPILVIVVNIVVGIIMYEHLPLFVPTHWNAAGKVDGACIKNYGVIFIVPIIQGFITLFLFLTYKIIGWSKQQISAEYPEVSMEMNRRFRYRWGTYLIVICTAFVVVYMFFNFSILGIIVLRAKTIVLILPLMMLILFVSVIGMAFWTGQGGSRIPVRTDADNIERGKDRDEDKYWIAGLIYFNKEDPSLFVEKRFGIGWGLNYGKFEAYLVIGFIIGAVFIMDYILKVIFLI